MKLLPELDIERSFFFGFSNSRFLQGFTVVDESSREGPSVRRILPLYQHNSFFAVRPLDFDNDVHSRDGIFVLCHRDSGKDFSSRGSALSGQTFRVIQEMKGSSADELELLFQFFELFHNAAVLEFAVGKHGCAGPENPCRLMAVAFSDIWSLT